MPSTACLINLSRAQSKLVSEGLPAHHSDWKLAAQLFGAAADRGNLEASFQMAWFALIGQEIPQSDHYAFWFWEEVSSRSTDPVLKPIATHMVGWMYYFGRGTQQDQQKGIKIIRDNESDGFKFGEAECLARWNTASSDSPASCKFFSLCQLGSDRDWLCKHLMGVCLSLGFGTAKDEKKAAGIFEQLATDGHSDSQYWVGEYLYRSGKVSSDYKKAFEWYYKSADQGNSYGQWKVGRYYWNAIGAPRNNAKAIEWLRKSAEQGNRYGQYDLGDCYESGEGVPKDIGTAIYWYRKSADQGHEYAIRNLKELGK
ncbi:uncharacterized protein BJ171DRAFT_565951 [Polychytrium aggregatum]|uniref:uncharacterized protein n=1 Tax=Polychytrium aggregatum TaxID=110093 RepID=UPI0022FDFD59|nr:uncharacterized protein BJ171DRAFT_565951 [Polychytrium aggregatum]KAI9207689.1 hypothetical protein BJ171DRAFT_565951 [Polychytrium aggregatum]